MSFYQGNHILSTVSTTYVDETLVDMRQVRAGMGVIKGGRPLSSTVLGDAWSRYHLISEGRRATLGPK